MGIDLTSRESTLPPPEPHRGQLRIGGELCDLRRPLPSPPDLKAPTGAASVPTTSAPSIR